MVTNTLEKIKLSVRIKHGKLDSDIQDDIDGCLADLRVHGIVYKDDTDPLILNAIKLWCKSLYTDDTAKAVEFLRRYTAMRDCLKAAEGYGWKGDSDD